MKKMVESNMTSKVQGEFFGGNFAKRNVKASSGVLLLFSWNDIDVLHLCHSGEHKEIL
jgi:hypothetical protein